MAKKKRVFMILPVGLIIFICVAIFSGADAQAASFYGVGIAGNGLTNWPLSTYKCDYRFTAQYSGTVTGFRLYFIFRASGYYAGNGGNCLVQLQSDDGTTNHFPSGTVLASHLISDPMSGDGLSRLFTFDSPGTVTAGAIYHLVFSNTSSSAGSNWTSLDCLHEDGGTPIQPVYSETELAFLTTYGGGSWAIYRNTTPIFNIYYSSGQGQGVGYIDGYPGEASFGGSTYVRERFTPSSAVIVTSVGIKANGSGTITAALVDGTGNTIESVTLGTLGNNWYSANFATSHALSVGSTYSVVFSSSGSYTCTPVQNGGGYNFTAGAFNDDGGVNGGVEKSTNSGGSWSYVNTGWALSFYLGTTQSGSSRPAAPTGLKIISGS